MRSDGAPVNIAEPTRAFRPVPRGRRRRCARWLVLLGASLLSSACGGDTPPTVANVLIVMTEDQGAQAGYLGTPGVRTPHMDALARDGIAFRESFVVSPLCSPSKAALYTGRYPHANGLVANTVDYMRPADQLSAVQRRHPLYGLYRLREGVPTLIEELDRAGFLTGVTGKLHVAPNERFPFDRFLRTRGEPGAGPAAVRAFVEEAQRIDRPWLLVHSIKPPHRPYPDSEATEIGVDPAAVRPPAFLPDTPGVRRDWAEYLAAVGEADDALGTTLEVLRDSGQADRTLVVFTSDHGPAFQRGKGSPYDLGLRVPLVFSGPGVAPGRISDVRVSNIDIMPTLLELLGLPIPDGVQGRSLARLLRDEDAAEDLADRLVFAELSHGIPRPERGMRERSVYDGTWHLIHRVRPDAPRIVNNDVRRFEKWRNRTYDETVREKDAFPRAWQVLREIDNKRLGGSPPRVELYRLLDDPDELNDLAADPAHQATVQRLVARVRAFAASEALEAEARRAPAQ